MFAIQIPNVITLIFYCFVSGSPAAVAATSQSKQYASTLPRKFQGRSMIQPPPPPKRDPNTTLSVGRARAKSMVANLAAIGKFIFNVYRKVSGVYLHVALSQLVYK